MCGLASGRGPRGCGGSGAERAAAVAPARRAAVAPARCLVVQVVLDSGAVFKSWTVVEWGRLLRSVYTVTVGGRPLSATMVATRDRDYDSSTPRTRLQTSPAGVARRLLPAMTDPQRLRRARRLTAPVGVGDDGHAQAHVGPSSGTPAPHTMGKHAGADTATDVAAAPPFSQARTTGARTQQQRSGAGVPTQLVSAVADPQRLRRPRRMSDDLDGGRAMLGRLSGGPASGTAAPPMDGQYAGAGTTTSLEEPSPAAQGVDTGCIARRAPATTDPPPQRLTWRKTTNPDVDHYVQVVARAEPATGAPSPSADGEGAMMVAQDYVSPADALDVGDASHAGPSSLTLPVAGDGLTQRRSRKNPLPRYIAPGSRAEEPTVGDSARTSAVYRSQEEAAHDGERFTTSSSETASSLLSPRAGLLPLFDDTSSGEDDIAPAPQAPVVPRVHRLPPEVGDRRFTSSQHAGAAGGSAGPASPPPAPVPQDSLPAEPPASLFCGVKSEHAASLSTTMVQTREVAVKMETMTVGAAAAVPVPDTRVRPAVGLGAQARTDGVRRRFVPSQRPFIELARAASSAGRAGGSNHPVADRNTPGRGEGAAGAGADGHGHDPAGAGTRAGRANRPQGA